MDHMEFTQLSLAGKGEGDGEGEGESEASLRMKRKWRAEEVVASPNVDLQLHQPLPSDWEQCLDLQSGKMYYVNKTTLRKSWSRPLKQEQKLDLELNISMAGSSDSSGHYYSSNNNNYYNYGQYYSSSSSSSSAMNNNNNNNMVALACANCHLLVILSRSSPSCPNCKYVHSLESYPATATTNTGSRWPI